MAKATITRALLRDLPPLQDGVVKTRIFDDRLTGFIAEQRSGGVTLYFRYADARRRDREIKLGRLGDVTVDQARKRAEQLKASVSLGADPLAELDRKRAVPIFETFVRERYLPHVQERLRSAGNIEAYLRKRILPALGRKALDEIGQDDVAALRRGLIDEGLSPSSVNRHLATLRSMFNLALRWQLFEGRNPAASPGMLRERHRDVYLDAAQTQALVRALDADRCPDSAAALALLAVTGARKNEVLRATWDLVDLGRGVLTVPRSKSGKPRHIPLSPYAAAILQRQLARRAAGGGQSLRLPQPRPRQAMPGEPARRLGAGEEAGRAAQGAAHPRSAAQLRLGAGQLGHSAQRDRHGARPLPAQHHGALRPPRAAEAGGNGDDGAAGVESAVHHSAPRRGKSGGNRLSRRRRAAANHRQCCDPQGRAHGPAGSMGLLALGHQQPTDNEGETKMKCPKCGEESVLPHKDGSKIGGAIGGAAGAAAGGFGLLEGAAAGALAGTAVLPVIGTALGAASGAVAGVIGGWLLGSKLGESVGVQFDGFKCHSCGYQWS
jgi:integrase